jgi:hypothetical protein
MTSESKIILEICRIFGYSSVKAKINLPIRLTNMEKEALNESSHVS